MPIEFVWNDAWILMAVYGAQRDGDATLPRIIGNADLLNHAIPTTNELNRALGRLAQADLLAVHDDQFTLSPEIRAEIDALHARPGGLFSLPDKALELLKRLAPAPTAATEPNRPTVDLTDEQVSRAYDAYRRSLR